jgi:acyl-CoA thioesterase-2
VWARIRPEEFEESTYPSVVATRYALRGPDGRGYSHDGITAQFTWFKALAPMPDDQLLHRCGLTYMADLVLAPTAALTHQPPRPLREGRAQVELASLDFAVWFHRPVQADEWLLFQMRSPSSGDGRGMVVGDVWNIDGRYVASVAQETVLRLGRTTI